MVTCVQLKWKLTAVARGAYLSPASRAFRSSFSPAGLPHYTLPSLIIHVVCHKSVQVGFRAELELPEELLFLYKAGLEPATTVP